MKKFTAYILIALVCLSDIHAITTETRFRANRLRAETEVQAEAEAQVEVEADSQLEAHTETRFDVDYTGLTKACLSSLMDAIPPDFCWKKGADAGTIPTGCPSGWFRSLALCYQNCRSGYSFTAGVCWQDCPSGWSTVLFTCTKAWNWPKTRDSYIPSSKTNFDSDIPCPSGMYRMGALCYRDCNKINMVNCGIGGCASSADTCATSIISMALDTLQGVASGIAFIASFGASSAATTTAKAGLKTAAQKAGPAAMKAAFNNLRSKLTGAFAKGIKDRAISLAKTAGKKFLTLVGENLAQSALETYVASYCQPIMDSMTNRTVASSGPSQALDTLISTVDIFGVQDLVKGCSNTKADGGLDCAKAAVSTLSTFDPTGLLTIAAAFMHPQCDGV